VDTLDNIAEAELTPGVRSWILEAACLSTVGTFKAGVVAEDVELNERGLRGLGIAVADKGVRGLSTVGSTEVSLLILFCGSERGDGL